jgi:hypothetical protein
MTTIDATPGAPPEVDTGTALSTENRSIDIDGATLVYRRFGDSETEAPPLVCLQHFRGNLDNWDPGQPSRDRPGGRRARQPRRRRLDGSRA